MRTSENHGRGARPRSRPLARLLAWPLAWVFAWSGASCEAGGDAPTWDDVDRRVQAVAEGVPHVSTAELAALLEAGEPVLLLDVRSPAEFEVARLAGAVRVADEAAALELAAGHAGPVVAYCSVGVRSGALAHALRARGVENVSNLRGSLFAWANEGRPLVDDAGATEVVHPYDERWGALLEPARRAPRERW